MSKNNVLFLYPELGILKVCIVPAEPFYTIPLIAATKDGEEIAFGEDALEKDESWELNWLQGGKAQKDLFIALFRFVFLQPQVLKAEAKCNKILVAIQCALRTFRSGTGDYLDSNADHVFSFKTLLPTNSCSESFLASSAVEGNHSRFSLNILEDHTSMRYFRPWGTMRWSTRYVIVGVGAVVNLFIKLLCEKGYSFTDTRDRLLCYKLVMDYCYVALDFDKELERIEKLDGPLHEITLEDGSILELGKECIMATEVLFKPELVGKDEKSIMSLFQQYYFADWSNSPPVLLIGGCASSLKGLGERIQQELRHIDCINAPIQIIKTEIREDAAKAMEVKFGFK